MKNTKTKEKNSNTTEVFPILTVVRGLLEADEFPFLFSRSVQLASEVYPSASVGIISKKDDSYYLMSAAPVREWIHFPIQIDQDLRHIPTDCYFKELEISLPELKTQKYLFFPLQAEARGNLTIEGWFFISIDAIADSVKQEYLFLFVDILREALKKIEKIEKIKELTSIDEVTGLYNTRHLFSILDQAVVQSGRYFTEFSLIFFDLDHFKSVNDTYGHLIGTRLLKEMAGLIKKHLRQVDLAFRYGGDEFVVYLPFTSKTNARYVVERLWDNIRRTEFDMDGVKINLTASFGTAGFPEDGRTVKEIIAHADEAMYRVKKRSRDGIEMA